MAEDPRVRLCFVCLGNICRSPTAAAVMEHRLRAAGLAGRVAIESAGTGSWHVGEPPDRRAAAEARRRGIPMRNEARQFRPADFDRFDLVLAMDSENAGELERIAPSREARQKIRLLRSFGAGATGDLAVPDPYFGGEDGFASVFDIIDDACLGLLEDLRRGPLAAP